MRFGNLIIFLSILGILLFRLFSIPPFDPPDEQSHFAQINFFLNEGRMPNIKDELNLSAEEAYAERIIGTMSEGENKYFFHPEYRYEMVSGYVGKYEPDISTYDTPINRYTYVAPQSSTYPPLYYWLGSIFHQLVANQPFFTRLYTVRFASLLVTMFLPVVAYFFGRIIWGRSLFTITLSFMVFFFPMTTYLGVGINSDNLHFLLFALALYLYGVFIKNGPAPKNSVAIGMVIGLDLITKPQGYILFPIGLFTLIVRGHFSERRLWVRQLPYLILPILALAGWQEIPKFVYGNAALGSTAYLARQLNFTGWDHFKTYLSYYIATHAREIIVWYWGVFKWSGVILPRLWWQIANRLVILAALGVGLHWYRDYRKYQFSLLSRFQLFSLATIIVYVLAIAMFDWQFYQEFGHSLGLQARYYLPTLLPQMFLLLSGLTELGWTATIRSYLARSIIIFFFLLHIVSVYVQLASYYDFTSVSTLFAQLSQYKPQLAKGNWWYLWISTYLIGTLTLLKLCLTKGKSK